MFTSAVIALKDYKEIINIKKYQELEEEFSTRKPSAK